MFSSTGGALRRRPRQADLGATRLGRRPAARRDHPRRLALALAPWPTRRALETEKTHRQFRGAAPGPFPAPPRLGGPREICFRALWAQENFQNKQKNQFSTNAKNAPPLALICPISHERRFASRIKVLPARSSLMQGRPERCDTRSNNPPLHPGTRTRDRARRRASSRASEATRLLGLNSTVAVHPSREHTSTLARAEGGQQVAGKGRCRAETQPGFQACTKFCRHGNNTAHHDIKTNTVPYIPFHERNTHRALHLS